MNHEATKLKERHPDLQFEATTLDPSESVASSTRFADLELVVATATPRPRRPRLVAWIATFVLLAGAPAAFYGLNSGDTEHIALWPLPTVELSHDEIVEDLVNRGLVPEQALAPRELTRDELIRDAVNRGLIPRAALDEKT